MRGLPGWIERRILDRHVASRCMVFAALTLPICLIIWGLQAYALAHPEAGAFYRPGSLQTAQRMLTALILWLVGISVFAWHLHRNGRDAHWMPRWTVMPTFAVLLLLSIGHGLKDTPVGTVLIEELVVARALFSLRTLRPTLIMAVAMMLIGDWLVVTERMVYAPLLTEPVFTGQELAWWWTVWLRVVFLASVLPFSAILFFAFHALGRQRKQLESLIRTDVLTGLANRREFMNQLEVESHRHARSGQTFCLVACDIDHFKKVNDSWGHPAGDAVLAQLGRIMQSTTRDQIDTAARIGGEEFVLILPDTDLGGALRVAQKISDSLRAHVFQSEGASFGVTQSIGITEVHGGEGEHALRVADQNLYAAKRAGRDQIVASVVQPVQTEPA